MTADDQVPGIVPMIGNGHIPKFSILTVLPRAGRKRLHGDPRMLGLFKLIEAEPDRVPSEEEAVRYVGRSETEFRVVLDRIVRQQYMAFVWEFRLQYARFLLKRTQLHEDIIADFLGYSSDATLSRGYSRRFGELPRETRAHARTQRNRTVRDSHASWTSKDRKDTIAATSPDRVDRTAEPQSAGVTGTPDGSTVTSERSTGANETSQADGGAS